jgi:hypothetical protein
VSRLLPRVVLAAFAVLLVVATVATVLRHVTRVLGNNGIAQSAFVVTVPPGDAACQAIPAPPAGTEALRVTLGVYGDPRARLRVRIGRRTGTPAVSVRDGAQDLPAPGAAGADRLCIENAGGRRVELAGVTAPPEGAATVEGKPAKGVFGVVYMSGPPDTWAERIDTLFARIGFAKGLPGGWATAPVLVLFLAAALGGALALSWKVLRS